MGIYDEMKRQRAQAGEPAKARPVLAPRRVTTAPTAASRRAALSYVQQKGYQPVAGVDERVREGGGWGFSDGTKRTVYSRRGDLLSTVTNGLWSVVEGGYMALQGAGAAAEVAAEEVDNLARRTGVAEKLSYQGNLFLPGTAVMALSEAFPAGTEGLLSAPQGILKVGAAQVVRRVAPKPVLLKATQRAAKAVEVEAEAAPKPMGKPSVEAVGAPKVATSARKAEPEAGALLSADELKALPPESIKARVEQRLAPMSHEDATALLTRIEKAEADGLTFDDPHYRSLLNVDFDGTDIDPKRVLTAVNAFEETQEALFEKVGSTRQSMAQLDADVTSSLEGGLLVDELSEALERSRQNVRDVRTAAHVMSLSGVQLLRAKDELLPQVLKGVEGSRQLLTDAVVKSAQLYAMGRGIVSNSGRALRSLQGKMGLLVDDVADDVWELQADQIRTRVEKALKNLGDEDLSALIGRMRTQDDLAQVGELLQKPELAESYSAWRRTLNSVSNMVRSNALSPATGLFNSASAVMHDYFRNDLGRRWAALRAANGGMADEVMALRLELQVGNAVYWQAHRQGLSAMLKRIQWEFWGDVEKVAGVAFDGGKTARGKRAKLVDGGYIPPAIREAHNQPRAVVSDVSAFNERLAARRVEGGSFAALMNTAERAGATFLNTADALGSASMKLFTGAVDDWGRGFVRVKETYMQSARYAVREGIEIGLEGEELSSYVTNRARQLAEVPNEEILKRVEDSLLQGRELSEEDRFLVSRDELLEREAEAVLFMDGPQTAFGNTSAKFAAGIDKIAGLGLIEGVLMPYIRTPVRLFERGLVDYTPWGANAKAIRETLAKGGPEAELTKARMELGGMAIAAGMAMGLTGTLVLTNGEWGNTGWLDSGPPNRLQIGDKFVEVSRLDPFSLTVAIGGIVGQAIRQGFHDGTDQDASEGIRGALQVAWMASLDSVLSKSYLTGLRDFTEIAFDTSVGDAGDKAAKVYTSVLTRLVPMSGTGRMVNDTSRYSAPEAIGLADQMLRTIPGAGIHLPVRRDILGDPVKGRSFGIAFGDSGTTEGKPLTSVKAKLRDLGITLQDLRKTDPKGFRLTGEQLDELRRIRGHEALDGEGRTMQEALGELFASGEFRGMAKEAKKEAVADAIRQFNEPARQLLEERNAQYYSSREAARALADYRKDGMGPDEAEQEMLAYIRSEGLPEPQR